MADTMTDAMVDTAPDTTDTMALDPEYPPGEPVIADASSASAPPYWDRLARRRAAFKCHPLLNSPEFHPRFYTHQITALPHGAGVHAAVFPKYGLNLYSAGQDGYIRQYSLDSHGPRLKYYWENEAPGPWVDILLSQKESAFAASEGIPSGLPTSSKPFKYGPKTQNILYNSPVFSLTIQQDELWAISGTNHGSLNLCTVRHDTGQTRHVFKPNDDALLGHRLRYPISALTLDPSEHSCLSGGWDARIIEWDLNSGSVARTYENHLAPIASLQFRPDGSSLSFTSARGDSSDAHNDDDIFTSPSENDVSPTEKTLGASQFSDANPSSDANPAPSDANPTNPTEPAFAAPDTAQDDQTQQPDTESSDASQKRAPVPVFGSLQDAPALSRDVLLSASTDGHVLLWDRRIPQGSIGDVSRLASDGIVSHWTQAASWSLSGDEIFVGRHDGSTSIHDIRSMSPSQPYLRLLRPPSKSGPVSSLCALPTGRHVAIANDDGIRFWDLSQDSSSHPFKLVDGSSVGHVSSLAVDSTCRFLAAASGSRGWDITTPASDELFLYELCLSQ